MRRSLPPPASTKSPLLQQNNNVSISSMRNLPPPPTCQRRPEQVSHNFNILPSRSENVNASNLHDNNENESHHHQEDPLSPILLDRPYNWLKNISSDPSVKKYLRSEVDYTAKVFKQHPALSALKKTLVDELENRSTGGDAQIPTLRNGYYYYETTTVPDSELSTKKVNKHLSKMRQQKVQKAGGVDDDEGENDDDSDEEADHLICYRVPFETSSLDGCNNAQQQSKQHPKSIIDTFSEKFTQDPSAEIKHHPKGAEIYLDLNLVSVRLEKYFLNNKNENISSNANNNNHNSKSNIQNKKINKKEKSEYQPGEYCEQEDMEISPNNKTVVCSLDLTPGAEKHTIVVIDCATQRQLCTVGLGPGQNKSNEKINHNVLNNNSFTGTSATSSRSECRHIGNDDEITSNCSSDYCSSPPPSASSQQVSSRQHHQKIKQVTKHDRDLGFVIDAAEPEVEQEKMFQIEVCGDFVLWLDDSTFSFIELDPITLRRARVWAVYLSELDDVNNGDSTKNNKNKKINKEINSKNKNKKQSSCHLYLLHEETDPCYEVTGFWNTTDGKYVVIESSTSSTASSFVVDLSRKTEVQVPSSHKNNNDDHHFVKIFTAKPFLPKRIEGRAYSIEHDSRSLEYFKILKSDDHNNNNNNNTKGKQNSNSGGTWIITHNLHDDGSLFKVDIASDNNEKEGGSGDQNVLFDSTSSWISFFEPIIPREVYSPLLLSHSSNNNKNNHRNSSTKLQNYSFVEGASCFKNFIIFTIRKNGNQNLLFFDLLNNTKNNRNNNLDKSSTFSSISSSILSESDLIDIHKVCFFCDDDSNSKCYDDESTTWLDLNAECDYETSVIRFTAHNLIIPDREFMLFFGTDLKDERAVVNNTSENSQLQDFVSWRSKLLLYDTQNHFNPKKYHCEMIHVPVPVYPMNTYPNHNNNNNNNNNNDNYDEANAILKVEIPVLIAYRKDKFCSSPDIAPSSSSSLQSSTIPVLLSSYGSYGSPYEPEFNAGRVSLLNRGVVIAIASVRGGGEYGEIWRQGGSRENRPCTFSDFISVAEWFKNGNGNSILLPPSSPASNKRTATAAATSSFKKPEIKICCYGESAAGSTIGNCINQRPDLFVGAVARVPFVNCLDSLLDESMPLTRQEWADWMNPAESRENFDLIRSYSPIDNVRINVGNNNNNNSSCSKNIKNKRKNIKGGKDLDDEEFEAILNSFEKENKNKPTSTKKNNKFNASQDQKNSLQKQQENHTNSEATAVASSSTCKNGKGYNNHILPPFIYVESGLHDVRVKYHEAAIWVALLREKNLNNNNNNNVGGINTPSLILHQINFEGGHDGAADVDEDEQLAQEFAFILTSLGISK